MGVALGMAFIFCVLPLTVMLCGSAMHAAEEAHLFEHHEPRERRRGERVLHTMHSTQSEISARTRKVWSRRANSARDLMFTSRLSSGSRSEGGSESEPGFVPAPPPGVNTIPLPPADPPVRNAVDVESVELGVIGDAYSFEAKVGQLSTLVATFAASTAVFEAKQNILNLTKAVNDLPTEVVQANQDIKMIKMNAAALQVKSIVGESMWNSVCRAPYIDLGHVILNKMELTRLVPRANSTRLILSL